MIVRAYETHNQRGEVEFEFAFQIKRVIETNLLEEEEKILSWSGKKFKSYFNPYEIKTFNLDFK